MERTTNNIQALIMGINNRLMETYMAELICEALHYGESVYWFNVRRQDLRDNLNELLKKENSNGR